MINSFAASYEKITSGLSSTLSWNVSGASEISIEQNVGTDIGVVNATGTKSVEPEATTEYTLTATNTYGQVEAKVTIEVTDDPVIVRFTATPDSVMAGTSATSELQWEVIGADEISIDQGIGSVGATGTRTTPIIEADITYTITATNDSGGEATATVTITATI